ncbi:aldolase catalytic domain-containing protein [Treponema sp. Marseille-Q4523]|uniref:aldolase catalytic domain-containing protein n=1 Tax=Treponema sp. Marseille-Q4523 TaxID=2810610 RepID=UPI00196128F8|nr:aldolase catalytic domain-containing protein [Treponema sp. Marseille-Q4523]MBM7023989.1 aldolase catalytic domain-containing protein [Treponema sp. Marseille-Q4523]
MKKIYLLDCTLRDGGFVNNWAFGEGCIKNIFSRLDISGIDTIEVGFIDERETYDANRSMYPDTKSIEPIFDNIRPPQALVCAMIDYGTCSIDKVAPKTESHLDAIRIIFKKSKQDEALKFCAQVKEKGYKIFVNPVSITGYTDEEIIALVNKINKISPYAVTVVDTYGLMHSQAVLRYCNILNTYLDKDIIIGYHAHNNFQLAYSNAIAVMNGIENRDISIDGSLFGMGKSAGNACTELLAMYMNEYKNKHYDINQIQEAIDVDIQKEYIKSPWGYRQKYYIAALHGCHPNYVQYLLDKKTLSIKSINIILERIPDSIKLLYDKNAIETFYYDYQNNEINDSDTVAMLQKLFEKQPILLLGPGKSIEAEKEKIQRFIVEEKPIVISVNFLNKSFAIDYVFMGNAKRYSQFFNALHDTNRIKTICTSNITETDKKIDFIVNYSSLLSRIDCIRDNPLVMLLYLLKKLHKTEVTLAGFDGYVEQNTQNYYEAYIPMLFCQENVLLRNQAIKEEIVLLKNAITVRSLTKTKYL